MTEVDWPSKTLQHLFIKCMFPREKPQSGTACDFPTGDWILELVFPKLGDLLCFEVGHILQGWPRNFPGTWVPSLGGLRTFIFFSIKTIHVDLNTCLYIYVYTDRKCMYAQIGRLCVYIYIYICSYLYTYLKIYYKYIYIYIIYIWYA